MSPRKKSMKKYFKSRKPGRLSTTMHSLSVMETLEDEMKAVLAALRSDMPSSLPGRDEHIEKINQLLWKCIDCKQSSSIYIYGAPGHGKTASLKMIMNQTHIQSNMNVAYIDCRKLTAAVDVYEAIIFSLNSKSKQKTKIFNIKKIVELMKSKTKPTLLVLDEMDRLKTTTDSVLYSLLELRSLLPAGKIVIIGVGNAQNFIDTLPLVKNNDALEPILVEFGSYSKNDIKEMLSERLRSISLQRLIFSDTAIELLAAKTEVFGDARVSLGLAETIVRNAFDKVDGDAIYKIDPFSVISAFNKAFGNEDKTIEGKDGIDLLPLPQKLIICSVVLTLKKKICAAKDLTLNHVYSQYKEISKKKGMETLSQSEFLYACRMIEQQSFFNRKKSSKKSISWDDKILLKGDESELLNTLMTKPLLRDIFIT